MKTNISKLAKCIKQISLGICGIKGTKSLQSVKKLVSMIECVVSNTDFNGRDTFYILVSKVDGFVNFTTSRPSKGIFIEVYVCIDKSLIASLHFDNEIQ